MGCHGTAWRLGTQGMWSIIASLLIIWFGLRSFSGTYLSEAASTVVRQSRRNNRRGVLYRYLAASGGAITGAAVGLGAFCFISQMIRRDRLLWRAILTQTWILLLITVAVIVALARFGAVALSHILPHILGLIILAVCINLPTTEFSNASWIYLTAPIGMVRAFARGICGALWVPLVALPHAFLLIVITLFVNWRDAVFVTGFNLIVVSLYLAFGIGMISGLPFSSKVSESRNIVNSIYIQVCGLFAIVFPIVVQVNVWAIWRYALIAAIVMCCGIWFVVRLNLGRLEKEILWRLYLLKLGPKQMFREFE